VRAPVSGDMTPCQSVRIYSSSREACCLNLQGNPLFLDYPDDGGSKHLQNTDMYNLQGNIAQKTEMIFSTARIISNVTKLSKLV
jgi:hypothetical protein